MTQPPQLLPFDGDWSHYEELLYREFVDTFVTAGVRFRGCPVQAPYRPAYKGKHHSFWHTISEAPDRNNRNEEDRIPDLRRCERIRWIAWLILQADTEDARCWENERHGSTHVVIWAEPHDFAVVLAKRRDYYVFKTAYAEIKPHRRDAFEREWRTFCRR